MTNTAAARPLEPEAGFPHPYLPSLSLVPESRTSLLRRRRVVRKALIVTIVTALAIVGLIVMLIIGLVAAKSAENSAVSDMKEVQANVNTLLPVQDLYEGFEERQGAVANALASDVDYYRLLTSIQDALQAEIPRDALIEDQDGQWYVKDDYAGIGLVSYSVSAEACPSDEPFQPEPALGCITASGTASSYVAAAEAIAALNEADNGLFGGYILSASDDAPVGSVGRTSFSFSVNYGVGALSDKYSEEADAILEPGAPGAAAPSPQPAPSTEGSN